MKNRLFNIKWMPILILGLSLLSSMGLWAQQTGVNKKDPNKTLDIDGDARIRTIKPITGLPKSADVAMLMYLPTEGNLLQKAASADVIASSGLLSQGSTQITIGTKAARIDYNGFETLNANAPYTFSVLYVVGKGFVILQDVVIGGMATGYLTIINSNTLQVTINRNSGTISNNSFIILLVAGSPGQAVIRTGITGTCKVTPILD